MSRLELGGQVTAQRHSLWRTLAPLALALGGCADAPQTADPSGGQNVGGIGPQASKEPSDQENESQSEDEPADSGDVPSPDNHDSNFPDSDPDQAELLNCDIDFLFVVDNSRSMASKQANLVASVPQFVETLTKELDHEVDFHLGVVTTDVYEGNATDCRQMGAFVTQTAGTDSSNAVCGPFGPDKSRRFMTRDDDLARDFPCAATPGTVGAGDEKPMEAMGSALTPAMLNEGGCNEGFLRKDAILVTVIISDEDDQQTILGTGSKGDPASWKQTLLAAKGNDPQRVVVLGLVGQQEPNECDELDFGTPGVRLMDFIGRFGKRGFMGDVCSENYDPFFEKALSILDLACEELDPPA